MVTSPHSLASATGVDVLRAGGSAIDAAIATSAVLSVVYPHMTGLGGDAFWLIHDGASGEIRTLNGGGKAAAATNPIYGADRVARFVLGIARKDPPASIELADINGAPGVILRRKSGRIDTVMLLEVGEGRVGRVYSMRNPDKLARVG